MYAIEVLARDVCNRNLVQWVAGRQMFCPHCDKILDRKTTVLTRKGKAICGTCLDRALANIRERSGHRFDPDPYGKHGLTLEHRMTVIDERLAKMR
jgi:hypothetical protein